MKAGGLPMRPRNKMAENTKIEWATHSFNPWIGCTKISRACDHCYAESMTRRWGHPELWEGERRRTSEAYWKKPLGWNQRAASSGERPRVFCASLADVFDNQVPGEWRADLWKLVRATPNLDWLLLTKRPQNIEWMLPQGWYPDGWPNVWLGATCEDQLEYDRRFVPHLARLPARVRFISYEPALGPLKLGDSPPHWVIAGGESGPKARRTPEAWFRDMRDECQRKRVAFFQKQMTKKAPIPPDLMVREFPSTT